MLFFLTINMVVDLGKNVQIYTLHQTLYFKKIIGKKSLYISIVFTKTIIYNFSIIFEEHCFQNDLKPRTLSYSKFIPYLKMLSPFLEFVKFHTTTFCLNLFIDVDILENILKAVIIMMNCFGH